VALKAKGRGSYARILTEEKKKKIPKNGQDPYWKGMKKKSRVILSGRRGSEKEKIQKNTTEGDIEEEKRLSTTTK